MVVRGSHCSAPGQPVVLAFEGVVGMGTEGSGEIAVIPTEGSGAFQASLSVPHQIGSLQGSGGGTVTPGHYQLISKPAGCYAAFTVTG